MPIFRPGPGPFALALAMTGIKLGERLLYAGSGTPALFGTLAGKVGLTGRAAAVAEQRDEVAALTQAGVDAGTLVEVERAAPTSLPFDADSFDLVVVDATSGSLNDAGKWLPQVLRVLRVGGRLIVAERTGGGFLGGLLKAGGHSGAASHMLEATGCRPARVIADRDGWRFTEGLKRQGQ
jgi:SAM-dependent methyltransferase